MEIVNLNNLKDQDINSYLHKVRVVVLNSENKLFITDMMGSYNLPGGRVEENEDIQVTLKREVKEELGIDISLDEPIYLGNYHFYHAGFPEKGKTVFRDNEIDLFLLPNPKEYQQDNTNLTEDEKNQKFGIKFVKLEDIPQLLQEQSLNSFKKYTDIELAFLIQKFKEYMKGNEYVR